MDSNLILYMNKLYQLTSRFHGGQILDLPQIVVVGDQSAGKSSLLQTFIGKDFLPCGSDKVTRRPIMLQLIRLDKEEAMNKNVPVEYALFPEDKNPERRYTDFNQVKQKLHEAMKDVSKTEVVRDETIVLQIYSPNVVNLTLFDLPGLVATNVQDEPVEAPDMIRDLVKHHISDDNVIILAVVAGNTDLVTSSAIKLAEEMDPNGDRTVLAVTMLDLVNDEDAKDKTVNLLMGKTKQYKEGIVGVINRKTEVTNKRTIADIRADELTTLQKKFQPLASQKGFTGTLRLGSEYLQQLLSKLLVRRISEYMSEDMRKKIDQRMEQHRAALKMYGDGSKEVDKVATMEDAIVKFCRLFSDAITGNAKDLTKISPLIERSNYKIFFVDFPKELQALKNAPIFSDDYIQENIMVALGPKGHLSAPLNAFESMVREYIKLTRGPCRQTANNIKNGLSFTVEKCGKAMPAGISRFPVLMTAIIQKTLEFLNGKLEETKEKLETEIDMEWEYININHPDFDKICEDPNFQPKKTNPNTSTSQDNEKIHDLKRIKNNQSDALLPDSNFKLTINEKAYESKRVQELLLTDPREFKLAMTAYIDIIYRNICAMVPKVIFFCMINEAKEKLEGHLRDYFRINNDDELFDEPTDIIEKRADAIKGIRECEEATDVLADMRQYCSRHEG